MAVFQRNNIDEGSDKGQNEFKNYAAIGNGLTRFIGKPFLNLWLISLNQKVRCLKEKKKQKKKIKGLGDLLGAF